MLPRRGPAVVHAYEHRASPLMHAAQLPDQPGPLLLLRETRGSAHAGHVALNREDAAGFREFVKTGRELIENGASLAIFPEGTRTVDGKLKEFKKGAFTIATKAKAPVVPITILGSGDVMPSGKEGELHAGQIKIIVHPPIVTRGKKTSAVADETQAAIASRLPAWKTQELAA